MTPLVWQKKRYFSTTSMLSNQIMRPLFWLSTIAQEANKVLQGGVSLPFIAKAKSAKRKSTILICLTAFLSY